MAKYYSLVEIDRQNEEISYQINIDIDDNNVVVIEITLEQKDISVCEFSRDVGYAMNMVDSIFGKRNAPPIPLISNNYSIETDVYNRKIVTKIHNNNYNSAILQTELLSIFCILHMSFFENEN